MSAMTEIGEYLDAHGIGNLDSAPPLTYLGSKPDDPDEILVLTPYPGGPPEYTQDSTFPICERIQMQVLARARTMQRAEVLAYSAWNALAVVRNSTLSGTYYRSIVPNASPAMLGFDHRNRAQVFFNMLVEKEPSSVAVS